MNGFLDGNLISQRKQHFSGIELRVCDEIPVVEMTRRKVVSSCFSFNLYCKSWSREAVDEFTEQTAASTLTLMGTFPDSAILTVYSSGTTIPTQTSTATKTGIGVNIGTGVANLSFQPSPTATPALLETPLPVHTVEITPVTPTLIPLPTIKFKPLRITETPGLFTFDHSAGSLVVTKQKTQKASDLILRFWPIGLVFLIWLIIGIWFLITQRS